MPRVYRIDTGRLDAASRTPHGGLRAPAWPARSGVLEYAWGREYRPAEELQTIAAGLPAAPVTLGHPDSLVTPATYRQVAIGHVGDDARVDGDHVVASVVISDADAIAGIEAGSLRELSLGYEVELDVTPGVTEEGERYDAIQRNVRPNHVALGGIGWGRGGRDIALRLDSLGNVEIADINKPTQKEPKEMSEIEIGGVRVDASDAEAIAAAIERVREDAKAKAVADAEGSVAARVQARLALEKLAAEVGCGDCSGSDRDLLIRATRSDAATKASDDHLRGRLEAMVEAVKAATQPKAQPAAIATPITQRKDELGAAYERYVDRITNAWRRDAAAGRS